jgi:hypothetical protein
MGGLNDIFVGSQFQRDVIEDWITTTSVYDNGNMNYPRNFFDFPKALITAISWHILVKEYYIG